MMLNKFPCSIFCPFFAFIFIIEESVVWEGKLGVGGGGGGENVIQTGPMSDSNHKDIANSSYTSHSLFKRAFNLISLKMFE